ncbi:MAG: septum site-determining protein MinD [Myxococcales bacterium]|nr:septum site-determining protein MinD [Myxococcales bacterium]
MAECIVVTSGKGGVGKTTTAANLAAGIALAGKTCAVVDADIGLRNLDVVLGLENRIVYDLVQVVEGECRIKQALIRDKRVDGLFLLPAAQTRDKQSVSPEDMRRVVADLKELHDYVIIDCPAGIEQGFKNSVAGADRAIIVTTPEVSAIRDADRIIGLVEAHELPEPNLIINRYEPGMVERGDMMNRQDILEILAIPLIGIVPEHADIIVSTNRGVPAVFEEKSPPGQAFRRITDRVMGLHVDIPPMDASAGVWALFKRWMGMSPVREAV